MRRVDANSPACVYQVVQVWMQAHVCARAYAFETDGGARWLPLLATSLPVAHECYSVDDFGVVSCYSSCPQLHGSRHGSIRSIDQHLTYQAQQQGPDIVWHLDIIATQLGFLARCTESSFRSKLQWKELITIHKVAIVFGINNKTEWQQYDVHKRATFLRLFVSTQSLIKIQSALLLYWWF